MMILAVGVALLLTAKTVAGDLMRIYPSSNFWVRFERPLNLSCEFSSKHPQNVQWFKDGTRIRVNENTILSSKTITDSSDEFRTIVDYYKSRVSFDDAGTYMCKSGEVTKTINIQIVKGRLKIFPKTERLVTFKGETVTLTCEYEGSHRVEVKWTRKSGRDVKKNGFNLLTRTVTGSSTLTTKKEITKRVVTTSDSDEYTCTAGPLIKSVILEVYEGVCNHTLVSGQHGVPVSQITASSFYKDSRYIDAPSRVRLNTTEEKVKIRNREVILGGGWSAKDNDRKQWLQIKLKAQSVVRGLLTQGRAGGGCCNQSDWVTEFKLFFSQDGVVWHKYKDQSGVSLYFRANSDSDTIVLNELPSPIIAKYLKLVPTEWHNNIAMRVEIKGCVIPQNIRQVWPIESHQNLHVPDPLRITCEYSGPQKSGIKWLKDGLEISDSDGYLHETAQKLSGGRITVTKSIVKQKSMYQDSGNYTCLIPNTQLSKSVTIYAMKLDKIPSVERLWIVTNSAVKLTCEYRSRDRREVIWSFSGGSVNSKTFDISRDVKTVDGAILVTSAISKRQIDISDVGLYTCNVGEMARTWNVKVLSVGGNGTWQEITPQKTMYLECDVSSIPSDVVYELFWTKGGTPISELDSIGRMNYLPNSKTLQIINTQLSDAGQYECNILLEVGSPDQQQVTITKEIYAPPNASVDGMKKINVGDSLHIYCKTTGYPKPTIVWMKNGNSLSETSSRVTFLPYGGADNGHLVVFDVTDTEAGQYKCEAVSSNFKSASSHLQVEVKEVSLATNPTLLVAIIVGSVLALMAIICCGIFIKCNRKTKKKDLSYDMDSLERLRRSRPPFDDIRVSYMARPRNDTFIEDGSKIIKLSEEPRYYAKRPDVSTSSLKTLSTVNSDTYERCPLRNKTLSEEDDDESYNTSNTGTTHEKYRLSEIDMK